VEFKLLNENFKNNYCLNVLQSRGVKDINNYLNPSIKDIQNPEDLDNMDKGVELVKKIVDNSGSVLLIVDADNDGFTSSAIIYQYLKHLNQNIKIKPLLHEGKEHGISDHISEIIKNDKSYDLVICPDAGSNDFEYHEELKEVDIPCLIIDHHQLDTDVSSNTILINNQTSKKYLNKNLTGAGVILQFCRYLDKVFNIDYSNNFYDLAALGIIGDIGSILSNENNYIIHRGLSNVNNFFFKTLIKVQSFSMQGKVNPTTVAFYIVPLINAMVRAGSMDEKERMFLAFVDGHQLVKSNKRGSNGEEVEIAIESARECINAKSHQDNEKKKIIPNIEAKIEKLGLLDNKILFIVLNDEDVFPSVLNGLIATELTKKYKRPAIVARQGSDGYIKGSMRGLNNSKLTDFKKFLIDSNLFDYVQGHPQAAGISIKRANLSDFIKYSNEKLKDIDFGKNVFEANFCRESSSDDLELIIEDLDNFKDVWGPCSPEPTIVVRDIYINKDDINIIGKNKDTIRFKKNGITYIQFHAKGLIEDLKNAPFGNLSFQIFGRGNMNNYNGMLTPQVFIDSYDIQEESLSF
jgi:single-stranded-DNA-specific exonuclease